MSSTEQKPGHRDGDPTKTFEDLRELLTEEQVKAEADRCLKCGATTVDVNRCIGCGLCTTRCEFDAIKLERDNPEATVMYPLETGYTQVVPKFAEERAIKISKKYGTPIDITK